MSWRARETGTSSNSAFCTHLWLCQRWIHELHQWQQSPSSTLVPFVIAERSGKYFFEAPGCCAMWWSWNMQAICNFQLASASGKRLGKQFLLWKSGSSSIDRSWPLNHGEELHNCVVREGKNMSCRFLPQMWNAAEISWQTHEGWLLFQTNLVQEIHEPLGFWGKFLYNLKS